MILWAMYGVSHLLTDVNLSSTSIRICVGLYTCWNILSIIMLFSWFKFNMTLKLSFLVNQIWKVKTLPRITFFAWEVERECILTIDKLMKRSKILVNGCYMYKKAAESYNHILLWCSVMYNSWTIVYGLLGINWVIAWTVTDKLRAWNEICTRKKFVNLVHFIFWVMWKERKIEF